MPSLVDQILAQSEAGSAQGQSLIAPAIAGAQLGQNQQRINLERQQLMAELAQLPLKQTLLRQTSEMNALKLEDTLQQRDLLIKNEGAVQEAYNLAGQAMAAGNPEDAPVYVMDVMSRTLGASRDPRFQQLLKDVNDSATLKVRLQELKGARTIAPTAAIQNSGQLDALQQAYDAAVAGGNPAAIADAKRRLENFTTIVSPTTETIYDPATGRPLVERGKKTGAGGLTVATQTRLQEQELLGSEAVRRLSDAIAGIEANPSAIGVRGKVGTALEQARGQISPAEKFATPITDTRQKASTAFSAIAPVLRVDSGNMSKYELNKLEQAGDVLGVEEAPQTALNKLNNLRAVVVGRQLRTLKAQGKTADDTLLRSIQGEEIPGLLQSDLLTKEEALRLYNLR